MATIGTLLYTAFQGRFKGQDAYGNKYYEARREKVFSGQFKRWVVYQGLPEPTKVPPEWHGWLHYTVDTVPSAEDRQYAWVKAPQPNLTGTALAYLPPGHVNRGAKRAASVMDYQPWTPDA